MTALIRLMNELDSILIKGDYANECHCRSCKTLRPVHAALMQAREDASQESYRVFCEEAQAKGEAQKRAQELVASGGALAQARIMGSGRIEVKVDGTVVRICGGLFDFERFKNANNLKVTFE